MARFDHRSEDGITLIELLVIVVLIGVLASIAMPSFLNQVNRATDARAKSALANAHRALETFWSSNNTYAATTADLVSIEAALTEAENLTVDGRAQTFVLSVDSGHGSTFFIEKTAQTTVRRCTPAGMGGCLDDGSW